MQKSNSITANAGAGLRAPHYAQILSELPKIGWLEVHSENYFNPHSYPFYYLTRIREHYPISLHGVSLSLGAHSALNQEHLAQLKQLSAQIQPCFISDHLSWSTLEPHYLHDLLPLPYTDKTLAHIAARVQYVQDYLKTPLLLENISSYITYPQSTLAEWEFLNALVKKTGCGILLDLNNLYVNAINTGIDARAYLEKIAADAVQEIHLAGFSTTTINAESILIDTHSQPVATPVWDLYQYTLQLMGAKPTLIEWDNDIPPLATLLEEAQKVSYLLQHSGNGLFNKSHATES